MNKELPEEIKSFIESEAVERHPYPIGNYTGIASIRVGVLLRRQDFISGATSLYHHLKEERDKEMGVKNSLKDLYKYFQDQFGFLPTPSQVKEIREIINKCQDGSFLITW